jgi:hypothetical protein
MAQQKTAYDLTGERVAEVYGGLLHTAKNLEANLAIEQVYDGLGTPTALSVGGQGTGISVDGSISVSTDLKVTGNSNIQGSVTINNGLTLSGTSVNLANNTSVNDLIVNSPDSDVTARAKKTFEVGKLRVRETVVGSNYEITFGNPATSDPDTFKIVVDGTNNNFYIVNNSTITNRLSSPMWIDKSTSDVVVRRLKVVEQTNAIPIGLIAVFRNNAIPAGWLRCNGAQYSKLDLPGSVGYPKLYAHLGSEFNVSGSTQLFNVPNLQLQSVGNGSGNKEFVYCIRALEY